MKLVLKISFLFLVLFSSILFGGRISVDTGNSRFELEYSAKATGRYVTTDEIAKISDRRFYSPVKRKESIAIAGEPYVFSADNRFVLVSEATYDLGIPTIVTGEAMFVPLEPFLRIVAARFGMGAHIEGDMAVFNGDPIFKPVDPSSVERPSVAQNNTDNSCPEITQEPPEYGSDEELFDSQADDGDIELPEASEPAVVETPKPSPAPISAPVRVEEPPRKTKWRVVIDPGHGGKDPGASAADATREKDIVLEISKRLHKILSADTLFEAVLTRDKDIFLPLRDRTNFANDKNADLFISIHCNAARNKAARGTQVFFLAPAGSDHARATAALENASIFLEDPDTTGESDDLDFIITDLIQNEFLREASRLSVLVEESIVQKTGLPARGPQGAGFYVLKGSFMPGILVEAAFISNPDEAELLKKSDFQDKVAEGIADGVREFLRELPDY